MRFKYKYEHFDCNLCADMEDAGCPHPLCPYILENLDDLRRDPAFVGAVYDADMLLSHFTPTLIYLNWSGFPDRLPSPPVQVAPKPKPKPYKHNAQPECAGCPYPRVGQFCYGVDGSCVKSDYNATLRKCLPCPV